MSMSTIEKTWAGSKFPCAMIVVLTAESSGKALRNWNVSNSSRNWMRVKFVGKRAWIRALWEAMQSAKVAHSSPAVWVVVKNE
jgi:hypothetical protein